MDHFLFVLLSVFCFIADFGLTNGNELFYENIEIISFDKEYFVTPKVETTKIDEKQHSLSLEVEQLKDMKDAQVEMTVFMWENNAYVKSPIHEKMPLCDYIIDPALNIVLEVGTDGVHGNFPKSCSADKVILKGKYFLKDIVKASITDTYPVGRYKVAMNYYVDSKLIMDSFWYFTIA